MKKFMEIMAKCQIVVAGIFLGIFLVTVVVQITTRYLGIVATWTEDVSMYSFIWAVFMGAATQVYEGKHFAFTSISDALKNEKAKAILQILISALMLFFAILMIKYGIQLAKQFWNYTWVNIPSFKRGPTWLCLPICGITSAIYLVYHIVNGIVALRKGGNN